MAGASKTNSFGTFLETIEQEGVAPTAPADAAPPAPPGPTGAMTDVSRRVLQLLAAGPATLTQLREQAGVGEDDTVLADLAANGFVVRAPGRAGRFTLTAQGQAVVRL